MKIESLDFKLFATDGISSYYHRDILTTRVRLNLVLVKNQRVSLWTIGKQTVQNCFNGDFDQDLMELAVIKISYIYSKQTKNYPKIPVSKHSYFFSFK